MPTLNQAGIGEEQSTFDSGLKVTASTLRNLQQLLVYYDKESKIAERIAKSNTDAAKAMELLSKLEADKYKKSSLDERKKRNEELKTILDTKQAELDAQMEVDALNVRLTREQRRKFKNDKDAELEYRKQVAREAHKNELENLEEQRKVLEEQNAANDKALKTREKNLKRMIGEESARKRKEKREEELEKRRREYEELEREGADEETLRKKGREVRRAENRAANSEELSNKLNLNNLINKILSNIADKFDSAVERAERALADNYGKINARLEGTIITYGDMIDDLNKTLAMSPYVQQEKVLQQIGEAVDKGIAYNVEQRAFLEVIKDNIVSTFDAFNSNLTRLIRIQQEDSTAARLGLEASLKRLFNSQYADTTYLTDSFDSVSEALIEATAQMSKENAVEFEYTVQKWLGALSSLGLSSQGVQRIATGLGYLNSGNVQDLASDQQLQTLLAMSASRAGLNYGEKLTTGLTSEETNELLKAMVEYLSEIAEDTAENRVVRSAYGNVFNLSVSDIRAVSNMANTIDTIYNDQKSYENLLSETKYQMNQIYDRMSLAQLYSNVMNNASFGLGANIVNSSFQYGLYKAVDALDDLTGGFTLQMAPFGMGMSIDIFDTIKSAFAGIGMIGQIIKAFSNSTWDTDSLSKIGLSGYGSVDEATVTTRGTFVESMLDQTSGTSASTQIANASSEDVLADSVSSASDQQEEISSLTDEDEREEIDMKDLFYGLLSGTDARDVLGTMDSHIEDILEEVSKFGIFGSNIDDVVSAFRSGLIDSQPSTTIKSLMDDLKSQLFGDSNTLGFPSVTTAISTSTLVTSSALQSIESSIKSSYNEDNYQKVFIAGIGSSLGNDLPISFSTSQGSAGKPGWDQVTDYLEGMKSTLGYGKGDAASSSTLKDLAEFMVKTVGSNEDAGVGEGGLKVGLTSVNVSLSDMATIGTPWQYGKEYNFTQKW